ncbi:glycoside hydrolase family 3 protein [Cellulosimicrobium sp. Marseille-Q4280]|uniref:glycoside hydrolase family 3 protein n=1 Tax=Cellulosimicrobium sp. Marseille-Q4280 TaxID=2937992 RepID=UPI0020422C78|nr:glycoside hydrolase family 3 protein [Cellulosimicrobium sp. Marseille-Q4280]
MPPEAITDVPPYLREELPVPVRAADLLERLTPDERLALLHQHAPAVDRLGLAPFRTGTEALHGVSWLGTATVFPQPVGLAATWDPELLRRVGEAVGTEVRAKHAADATVSLNVWAPVVNPLRHPRWGRNEEGFSEDPHVTAWLASAYGRGLRGDHPRVWRTVPTLKHLLAYSSETDRAVTSSHVPLRLLHEWELPAFRGPLADGTAGAVMPGYNLTNGRPNHVARGLLDEMRSWTDGSIAVVSDAAAPTNLVVGERYFPDHVASHAASLRAGVDSFTDNDADPHLTLERLRVALEQGLISQDDVDRAALRVLELRLRTGELDVADDPWSGVGPDALDLPAHRALAREAVARSVVVLRNDPAGTGAPVLPLPAAPARVAVVGPLADRVLHDWYSGTPPYTTSVAAAVAARYPDAEVTVADGSDRVALRSTTTGAYLEVGDDPAVVTASSATAGASAHLDVTDWGDGVLTLRSVATGRLLSGASWIVSADADRVGGWVVQESFRRHLHGDGTWSLQHVASGRWLRVQHGSGLLVAEASGPDGAERFVWRTVRAGHEAVAQAACDADAVLVVVGNDPHLAGRETEDRPHLALPSAAEEVWRAARDVSERAALVVMSSYPYVLGPATHDAAAVVWSSHGGQELGPGLVDVLSGDAEPSGRLAQSWPAAEDQVGPLLEYDVQRAGATYRYADREPAFAFGHGLTYSRVTYASVGLDRGSVDAPAAWSARAVPDAGRVVARVVVHNGGDRPAEELVQLYALAPAGLPVPAPRRVLVAHARVRLDVGERREVTLAVDLARLAVWDVTATPADDRLADLLAGADPDLHVGAFRVQGATYVLAAGPSSAELPVRATLRVDGVDPAPRHGPGLRLLAHAFSAYDGVVTAERTAEAGWAVDVAPGRRDGWVAFDRVDLTGVGTVVLDVARTGPGAARPVQVEVRASGTDDAWVALAVVEPGQVAGNDGDTPVRHRWHEVAGGVDGPPARQADGPAHGRAEAHDVRVVVPAGVRLGAVRFAGTASDG